MLCSGPCPPYGSARLVSRSSSRKLNSSLKRYASRARRGHDVVLEIESKRTADGVEVDRTEHTDEQHQNGTFPKRVRTLCKA